MLSSNDLGETWDACFPAEVASVVNQASQKTPECNYSRGLCPLLHTRINSNWPQCVFKCMFSCACGSGRGYYWQLIPPRGLSSVLGLFHHACLGSCFHLSSLANSACIKHSFRSAICGVVKRTFIHFFEW